MKISLSCVLLIVSLTTALIIPKSPVNYKPYYPRQISSLNSTLSRINTSVAALTTSVNAYSGGAAAAASIATAQSQLDADIKTATISLQGTPKLSPTDSMAIIQATNGLTPGIINSIQALVSKQPQFMADGIGGNIIGGLVRSLKNDTDALGAAVVGITSDDQKTLAMQNVASIDAVFQSALTSFDM